MTVTTVVRAAFVDSEVVTAGQWDRAAAAGPDWEAVLAALRRAPAWWAAGGGAGAVTDYHTKLVHALLGAGSLEPLPRRLRSGPFLIRTELGRGGMGVVFRAVDTRSRAEVALKRVRTQSRQMASRFRREGEILARLDHPGIARFLGAERAGGHDVLVMEYVPGETASHKVRRLTRGGEVLPWRTAVGWAVEVLDALAHAHGRGVVHRDVKPGNIMVTGGPGSAVKLLDVGLAKCVGPQAGADLTADNQLLGTSEYMPPEQWAGGKDVTPAADLYALGGTLHFFLTGRSPYAGESTVQQMMQHVSAAAPDVRPLRPDVPARLADVIRRMMAKDPADRGTARELRWGLNAVLAAGGESEDRTAPAPRADARGGPGDPSGHAPAPRPRPPAAPSDLSVDRPTVTACGDGPTVTSGVWPLVREMGSEIRILTGLDPRRPTSVFDDPPLSRIFALGLAVTATLYDKLRGRPAA